MGAIGSEAPAPAKNAPKQEVFTTYKILSSTKNFVIEYFWKNFCNVFCKQEKFPVGAGQHKWMRSTQAKKDEEQKRKQQANAGGTNAPPDNQVESVPGYLMDVRSLKVLNKHFSYFFFKHVHFLFHNVVKMMPNGSKVKTFSQLFQKDQQVQGQGQSQPSMPKRQSHSNGNPRKIFKTKKQFKKSQKP